ncbi:MAG: OmpH family outer membrane protein [Bacteroidota bacterium]
MKLNLILISVICLVASIFQPLSAQDKIGYASVDAIMAYMPEMKTMQQTLATYEKKLAERLQAKQQYAQQKYAEYQEKAQATPPTPEAEMKALEEELRKLQAEIQAEAQKAEESLMKKRMTLMEPITDKLQTAIDEIAKSEGYTYVFNTRDGTGFSIVLKAPEGDDLTEKIMTKMGITVPKSEGSNP